MADDLSPATLHEVLDMLVQHRRDCRAALRLMRKLLKKQGFAPKLLVTDKLRSYGDAWKIGVLVGFAAGIVKIFAGGPARPREAPAEPQLASM